jgi:hypothetical protein
MSPASFARRLSLWLLFLALYFGLALHSQAAQVVPHRLTNAPPAIRKAYLEREGQESLREKLEVGRQRYQQRLQYKQDLVRLMRQQAQERNLIMSLSEPGSHDSVHPAKTPDQLLLYGIDWLAVVGMLALGVFLLWWRFKATAGPSQSQHSPKGPASWKNNTVFVLDEK